MLRAWLALENKTHTQRWNELTWGMLSLQEKSHAGFTRKYFYDPINAEFNFDFDPCPYNEGEILPENDGLLIEWGERNFVNPPYSI